MRIAVWHNTLSGGARRALYYQVRGLIERGHDIECWCPSTAERDYLPLRELAPEHVIPLDVNLRSTTGSVGRYSRAWRRMREMGRACRQAAQEIQSGGFDLLFANSCFFYYVPYILGHLNMSKVLYLQEPFRRFYEAAPMLPWVGQMRQGKHGWLARARNLIADQVELQGMRVQARREWLNVHACDAVLVNSYYSRESVLRAYGRESRVCYLGIDTTLFCNQHRQRENFIVGLGSFTHGKGLDRAIRAVARLPEPRPALVWVGNGGVSSYEEAMRRLAASLGVSFTSRMLISDAEVVEVLNRAALLVYTSRLEPFGFAPLEANACAAPVVAVAEGGVRETVKDGVNGLLVDGEPEAIARAMTQLLGDAERARDMGERACEYVRREWGLGRSIDRLEENLFRVIDKAHAQGNASCFAH